MQLPDFGPNLAVF